jgi:hypothetical protein
MGEFDFYDGQRDSDGRQRRRRLNYEDDGLGMADSADQADGSFANIEDYAGGMVDEFGRENNRYYRDFEENSAQGLSDEPVLPNPRYRRPGAPVPPLDPNQPSPAVQRAAQLMERANRRGRPATIDAPQGRSRRYGDDYVDESQPGGNILESLTSIGKGLNLNIPGLPNIDTRGIGKISNTILIALGVVAFLLCSCLFLLTAWIISLFTGG